MTIRQATVSMLWSLPHEDSMSEVAMIGSDQSMETVA